MRNLRHSLLSIASFLFFLPCVTVAQETIRVRAGEHETYSRLVIPVSPNSEWQFVVSSRQARLRIPDFAGTFETNEVFDRISRSRILSLKESDSGGNTELVVSLACDCLAEASVSGRYVVIDVHDEEKDDLAFNASRSRSQDIEGQTADTTPTNLAIASTQKPPVRSGDPILNDNSPNGDLAPPDAETNEMPPEANEVAQRLIDQLNRAAEQGLVDLVEESPSEEEKPANENDPQEETPSPPPEETFVASAATPKEANLDALESLAQRLERDLSLAFPGSGTDSSIRLRVPEESQADPSVNPIVLDEDLDEELAAIENENCIPDRQLDVANWRNHQSFSDQISSLRQQMIGEFDRPDLDVIVELARLYVANGFGPEAASLMREFDVSSRDGQIIVELANVVDGKPHQTGGILDLAIGCKGIVAMWRSAAIDRSETLPIDRPEQIIDELAKLPPNIRNIVGPRVAGSFLTRGQYEEAKLAFDIVNRAAEPKSHEHEVIRARLLEVEGKRQEAEAIYAHLIQENSPVSPEAIIRIVDSILTRKGKIPKQLFLDLESHAYLFRGEAVGSALRMAEIRAKSGSKRLADALSVVRQQLVEDPQRTKDYLEAAESILQAARVDEIGASTFSIAFFNFEELVSRPDLSPSTHTHLASQLIEAGLPNAAEHYLEVTTDDETIGMSELRARSYLAMGDPERAIQLLDNIVSTNASEIRVESLSALGQYQAAHQIIQLQDSAISDTQRISTAWRAGEWMHADFPQQDPKSVLAASMARMHASSSVSDQLISHQQDKQNIDVSPEEFVSLGPLTGNKPLKNSRTLIQQSRTVREFFEGALN